MHFRASVAWSPHRAPHCTALHRSAALLLTQNLDLTNNSLVGTIPSSVGALTALTTMDLTGNADIKLSVGASLNLKKLGMELGIAAAAGTAVVFSIVVPTIRRRRRRLVKISAMMVR